MPLTDSSVRQAKAKAKPYKIFDERGLHMLVTANGSKSWRLKYHIDGREKLIALGLYPDVTLKQARDRRDQARRMLADGKDPSQERQRQKAGRANTFKTLAEEWKAKQKHIADVTLGREWSRLERFVFPYLGNKPIDALEAPDLLDALRRIEARGANETAHRTRSLCGRIFRYAIATGRARRDPSADLRGALAPSRARNHPAIVDPRRLGELLRDIDAYANTGAPQVATALRIAPYVFVRPGELRNAEWAEFHFDAKHPEWRIPAKRMKMKALHIVPLARQVVALLEELKPITGDGHLVFPALTSSMRPISDNTLNFALRRMGYSAGEVTTHGFRSTASTLLNEQGWHPDLIELQLAHAERNEVRGAYNKAQRIDERRKMMQEWADYLDELKGAK